MHFHLHFILCFIWNPQKLIFLWHFKYGSTKNSSSINFPFPVLYIKMPVWPAPAYFHALKEQFESYRLPNIYLILNTMFPKRWKLSLLHHLLLCADIGQRFRFHATLWQEPRCRNRRNASNKCIIRKIYILNLIIRL